jgi:hypothetical protein
MQYLMDCSHVAAQDGWPDESMRCDECKATHRVIAIECREWHIKCNSCRFGRWFGQDEHTARRTAARHTHSCMVDYSRHPTHYDTLRKNYGRRVKPFILPAYGGNQIPGVRRHERTPVLQMLDKMVNPDVPPF